MVIDKMSKPTLEYQARKQLPKT